MIKKSGTIFLTMSHAVHSLYRLFYLFVTKGGFDGTSRVNDFHRYDLTTCIACDQCAKACPVDCIYIGKERVENGKGFLVSGFTIDYSKCMFCALCVEPCPVDCIFMGATHDLSCYSRDGCIVDFSRLPVDIAWGRSTLNPTAVAQSKVITEPVHCGPNQ